METFPSRADTPPFARPDPPVSRSGSIRRLVRAFYLATAAAAAFETLKQILLPHTTIWQSHAITMVLVGAASTVTLYLGRRVLSAAEAPFVQQIAFQASLLDRVGEGVVAVNDQFRITYWSQGAERLFGRTAPEVCGKDYAEAVQDDLDWPARNELRQQILAAGRLDFELACRTASGEERIVALAATLWRDEAGRPRGAVGIHRDITTRRRAEQALAASERRFQLAQGLLGIGAWELEAASQRVDLSPECLRLYGFHENAPKSMSLADARSLVHPQDLERMAREFETHWLEGPCNREWRVIWPDGSVHWILSRSYVVLDAGHRPSRIVGISFDITEKKRNEEQLQILSSAVEQSPVSIILTDTRGVIQYVNPKAAEVSGYTQDELLGQNPRILKSGETSPEQYSELWKTIPTGVWRGVFHNRKKSGELYWEAATIGPIRDESGVTTHYLGIKEDITGRRAMEAALRLSEERFRVAAQSSGDIIYEWDLGSDEVLIFGRKGIWFPTDDQGRPVRGSAFPSLIHAADRERVEAAIRRALETGAPYREEYCIVTPTGEFRYWSGSGAPVRDASGRPVKWVGVVKDVTETRAAERSNAELAAIVESSELAVISRDVAGNVLAWNAGAERIYGYSASEMIGRNARILVPPERLHEIEAINVRILAGERVNHLETLRLARSGAQVDVLMSVTPVRDRSGAVIGGAHLVWDISEFRHLQRQLIQAQKLESIGQLAAGIAHEINTPIQYIGDNAEFLAGAFGDLSRFVSRHAAIVTDLQAVDPVLAGSLDRVCREIEVDYLCQEIPHAIGQLAEGARQVARIVGAMKEFSHPGSADKVPLDINRAIQSTALVCRNEWKYVAELTTDLDPALPAVPTLAGELNQVLLNLIVNATHAIADVVNGSGRKGTIHITTGRSGPWAEIRVADTGTGIPEAIQSKVFDPFFTTKDVGKGTGQGLAIAYDVIVRKHSGRISFETRPERGTTFLVQLPLEEHEET